MLDVKLVEATQNDKETVLEMKEAFNAIDNYPFDRGNHGRLLEQLIENPQFGKLWLLTLEGEIVGYLVLAFGFSFEYGGRDAIIDEFFIIEEFRNKGYGKIAMDIVEEKAKLMGVKTFHLEVENGNEAGKHLYATRGFRGKDRSFLTKKL